jgi:hypothetical protein
MMVIILNGAQIASTNKQDLVIASSGVTKQSSLSQAEYPDCFAEPVIGRAFARPIGSQ